MEERKEESFAELLASHDAQRDDLLAGQKISGKIIAISGDDVFVDIGLKEDGVLDYKEILDSDGKRIADIGDNVEGFVVGKSSQGVKISRSMTGSGIAALEEAKDSGLPVEGRVKGACKGGYQIETLGKVAFCPGSQMEAVGEGEDITGKQMRFLITRIENHGRNIVVSRRALIERERAESLDKLLSGIKIGDIIEGKVTRLAPFGAFVEIAPFVEGMVHISELSWARIQSPEDAVAIGDQVKVKVLGMETDDKNRMRISLSYKQALGDPWEDIKFKTGDTVEGKVIRFAPFGAFVEIAPGLDGLIHLSEMSWEKRINKPEDALTLGEVVQVKIKDIDPDSKRIALSLRDSLGDPWAGVEKKFSPGALINGVVESSGPHGLFVTLAPGVTGLLPLSVIKGSENSAQLSKAGKGDTINVVVQKIDPQERRISLALPSSEDEEKENVKEWKKQAASSSAGDGFNIMAQALNKVFQKKGDKKA